MSGTVRVAGCDLGKARAKLAVLDVAPDGAWTLLRSEGAPHEGRPLDALRAWYEAGALEGCAALGATGLFGDLLRAPIVAGLPEQECLRAALAARAELPASVNVVSIGARGYAALSRDARGQVRFAESDKCSSGTGENVVRLAGRFGLDVAAADRAALAAPQAVAITARCSVFAKSEMTHFANQGTPAAELLAGYFGSIARHVAALLERIRVPGPVLALGGALELESIRAALGAELGQSVEVPSGARDFEAVGAALVALGAVRAGACAPLPLGFDDWLAPPAPRIPRLGAARAAARRVQRLEAAPIPEGAAGSPSVLGLDLGSTGSKAVLTSIATGDVVLDVYDRTRGNPLDATRRLLESILGRATPDVRAIGVTGSGREAVATVLRAAFPELAERIVVENEIVAHATAAIRCDESGGESLSIVEIGGQDAKFVQIAHGKIVESDLNRACSAGTGSFLEEQAVFHGITDIEELSRRASRAEAPPDLGQMCTVFVADTAAEALRQGFPLDDVLAGYQHSVIRNYLNRVVGQRVLARRVFFQGKPAVSEPLAWTLAAVTGREVTVPPRPGEMGAWGIGLVALEALGAARLLEGAPADLARLRRAEIVGRTTFQCKDAGCATLCRVDRTTVAVEGARHTVISGGACPKFEVATGSKRKLPRDAPDAFGEREALFASSASAQSGTGRAVVKIPVAGATGSLVPFLTTFVRALGLDAVLVRSDARTLARGEDRCGSYDACAPVKVAHGLALEPSDLVLFPKVVDLHDRDGCAGRTCPMEQAMPDLAALGAARDGASPRIVRPLLALADGLASPAARRALASAASALGADPERVPAALREAARAQSAAERALDEIGRRTLAYGAAHQIPVVVVCGALHTIHEPAVNARIPALLRESGVLALPMDAYPLEGAARGMERIAWAEARRAFAVVASARARGDAYPLWLSSFGCGPGSFNEHVFTALAEGYPHCVLESDGHGGAAGFVTRIQAFLYTVRRHASGPSPAPPSVLARLEPPPATPMRAERGSEVVVFPLGEGFAEMLASVYRSFGYAATGAPTASAATLELGKRDCSGKECIAYQQIWGSFRTELEARPSARRRLLLQVGGDGSCRNCAFPLKDELSLARHGLEARVAVRVAQPDPSVHPTFGVRFWSGAVTWGILHQLAAYHRVDAPDGTRVDELDAHFQARLAERLEREVGGGPAAWARPLRELRDLESLLDDAVRAYAAVARGASGARGAPTVLLSGNVYVRLDRASNDDLVGRLARHGVRVLVEPLSMLAEYFALEGSSDLVGLPTDPVGRTTYRVGMAVVRRRLYGRARASAPWLPMPSPSAVIERSRALLGGAPRGEAQITVASVLGAAAEGGLDGVVLASPWGCGPALVSESVLRRHLSLPLFVLYSDGSPLDERRLASFAFRVRARRGDAAPRGPSHVDASAAS